MAPLWWQRAIPLVCEPDRLLTRAPAWVLLAPILYWVLFFLVVGTGLTGPLLRQPRKLWLGVGGIAGLALPALLSIGPFLLLGAIALAAAGWRWGRPAPGDILAAVIASVLAPATVIGFPLALRTYYCGGG